MRMLLQVIREYFVNSSFHGFRFIAQADRHWTERIFWLVCCVLSWCGSILLILASWDNFQNNAISFAMETSYLEWDTDFPSVHVCEAGKVEYNYSLYGQESYDQAEILKEIAYFRGQATFITEACFPDGKLDPTAGCPEENLAAIASQFRTPCAGVFLSCSWNNVPFKCCSQFLPLQTEVGLCYSINSIHTQHDRQTEAPLRMVSNYSTGPGSLAFELTIPSEVFVLAGQDVPLAAGSGQSAHLVEPGTRLQRLVGVTDVENAAGVRAVREAQRKCRFPDEGGLNVYHYYSYSGCIAECRKHAQIRVCNCCSHQTPNAAPREMCNLTGLACLSRQFVYLSVLRHRTSRSDKLFCPCLLSCDHQVIDSTYGTVETIPDQNKATVQITMTGLPTERCKRNVVRGTLDLVVSMGATTALFVGASLLSFVELLYYFTLRLYGNIRLAQHKHRGPEPRASCPRQVHCLGLWQLKGQPVHSTRHIEFYP